MAVVLIHSMNGNEVHGADNDKRTGCGIRYSSPENHIKYSRQGEMRDINEITCPKCKEVLAKKLIRSSNKEAELSLKEERKKFARAKKMGMVSEATFEEYQMNKEAEFAEEMARRQMQESMQKPSYMQEAPKQTFDSYQEPVKPSEQPLIEEEDDDDGIKPDFVEYVPPSQANAAKHKTNDVDSVIPPPKKVLDVDDVLSQFMVQKTPVAEEPQFVKKKPVDNDILSQFMFKPASSEDESASPAPPPVVRQQHPAEIDSISPIPVEPANDSFVNNQDMIDLVRQTVMSENSYNESKEEPDSVRAKEEPMPEISGNSYVQVHPQDIHSTPQNNTMQGGFMSVTPPSPDRENEYIKSLSNTGRQESMEEEVPAVQPQIQYSKYKAPAAAVNDAVKPQAEVVVDDIEAALNQFSGAIGQYQRNQVQPVQSAAPIRQNTHQSDNAPISMVTPIFVNQPSKRSPAPAFLSPKSVTPMVDSIEEALNQLGAAVQRKSDGTVIEPKEERVPDFVEYVAPPKEKKSYSNNPYSAPAPSPAPTPVTSVKEAKRLAKLNEMFQKNLAENGYGTAEHKSKRRGK